ncbi:MULTISPECIES: bifunctional lysylphosphatidylglycerol flippase/synthetase MprF [Staphylococcus]|uniref:bifunctional lysylphosphatidylglycerol flippase/synthetase MprF n=1 Tax=Staphylococcus TaxID=1279 RepID=UPI0009D10EF8|nr:MULTISPECIES: bifunctional lysylphosphatidylglycerol flippase/synthetase MprF [Staphylococcus]QAV31695.1 phosphatidylglycerol lysyltransferase [Sulfitobacter donghicola]KAB7646070.1 bifunctional lysylphosphatidylglycerol flippase/synthetase MprF [Staphylococcus sp. B2-b]MBX7840323.1 bifunctional lysylphosphatidylglycerol flippase/synthetase MprF [Staphylococcus warneri]MCF7594059.1 bifunctional lysylphosphatidylglycerol flippase/synthetase MprF [Staphylococcus warneri]MCI2768864.1 bifunctio
MTQENKSKLLSILKFVFAATLFVFVVFTLYRELSTINFKDTLMQFGKINRLWLVLLFAGGGASLLILSLYDIILVKSLKLDIPLTKVFRVSYIINALNAIVGFGGFIGAGLRAFVYKNYTEDNKKLVHYISVILISMLTGLSLLSILVVFHVFNASDMLDRISWVRWILYIVALFLPIFIIYTIMKPADKNNRFMGVYCTLVSCVEWMAAAVVLYFSALIVGIDISFMNFIGIFIIAALSGLVSFIPGGFGAFDLVVLLGFKSLGVSEENILLALLLYRFAYYFVPVAIALVLSSFEFGNTAKKYIEGSKYFVPAKDVTSFLMSYQKDILSKIPSFSLAILVFLTSVIFFINNLTIIYDGLYDDNHFVYYITLSVHTSACLLLMLNVKGIFKQSRRAIIFAIISVVLIFAATIYTYASFLLLTWLVVIFVLLIIAYRRAKVVKRPLRLKNVFLIVIISLIVLYINHIIISSTLYALDVYNLEVDTTVLRYYFWITIALITLIVASIAWLFDYRYSKSNQNKDLTICEQIIHEYGGNYLTHLIYSGDKDYFVHDNESAFLMYRYKSNALVVLGDPVGDASSFESLLEAFYEYAEYYGYDIIFYQVSDRFMPLYHNFGNQFFKLGEEAIIDLTTFTTSGKKRRGFRATLNKFDDLNINFEVIEPPFSKEMIETLQHVSDQWLDGRNEMHFSVGQFSEEYLSKAPIGIMRNEDGKIIAFCTLMPTYFNDAISVDLIRWLPELDLPLMDGLYLHMLSWGKEKGYRSFNMGMATLSNVGQLHYSYLRERLAGRVFEHFNGLYRFQGLRRYKEKYGPNWEPRFLVYRKDASLWQSMIKVMRVIRHK